MVGWRGGGQLLRCSPQMSSLHTSLGAASGCGSAGEPAAVPVIYATEEDVRGSFAAFIEKRVDASSAVWRCGMCKIVLPEGFHIGGSAEKAREKVLSKGEFKVSII